MKTTELLNLLAQHHGRERGISACRLAQQMGLDTRELRRAISALRDEGTAICGTPASGYYLAMTPEELHESCKFLHDRAMHSLRRASRMQKIGLPELVGQLLINQA